MVNKVLYIMCGPAGGGKSTYIRNHAKPGVSAHISRDAIRFDMVRDDEYYFSRENEVYQEFCSEIHEALNCPWVEEVWADATHLTQKARRKLIKEARINMVNTLIIPVVVAPPVETILAQNAQRTGRECVLESVIRNMCDSFEDPEFDDIEYYNIIYI